MMKTDRSRRDLALHVLAGFLTLAFLFFGGMKLWGNQQMVASFASWGFLSWFLYLIGALELAGALLVALPRTRIFGALLLAVVMLGAVSTHLVHGEATETVPALVFLLLLDIQLYANRGVLFRRRRSAKDAEALNTV